MSNARMMKFVNEDQARPQTRAAGERRADFDEIYREFAQEAGAVQSSRCAQCGVPFCQSGCPLGNNIPDWLMLAAEGRMEEAYALSAATNMMPEVCGRICPQDRLCEQACVIEQSGHGSVTIGAVEKWITETAWDNGWVKPIRVGTRGRGSMGIVGAGPAGLAAAEQLRMLGYDVTVYDRYDRVGGLMIYGIPGFKLEKHVIERREARLREAGVTFELNCEIGGAKDMAWLQERHDAVLLAVGAYAARELTCPVDAEGAVAPALEYLTVSNRRGLGDVIDPQADATLNAEGRRVIVIGGGDTAMDCVRTAVRQGAQSVTCLYRRDRENMPGSRREVGHAEAEGVRFEWLAQPKAIAQSGNDVVVSAARMRLGAPDASGRQAPEPVPGGDFDVHADLVIKALGFSPEDMPAQLSAPQLAVNRHGNVKVDGTTQMTRMDGVFAAGDVSRGASLVVWAIRDGMAAAHGMHHYVRAKRVGPDAPQDSKARRPASTPVSSVAVAAE